MSTVQCCETLLRLPFTFLCVERLLLLWHLRIASSSAAAAKEIDSGPLSLRVSQAAHFFVAAVFTRVQIWHVHGNSLQIDSIKIICTGERQLSESKEACAILLKYILYELIVAIKQQKAHMDKDAEAPLVMNGKYSAMRNLKNTSLQ